MTADEQYMHRCLQLAEMGAGFVAPNPMVGAVLVYKGRIIGEGYHMQYGKAHAEVNCINSVAEKDHDLIASSTIYVSLEPCAHFGKTPPCADLIIAKKIPNVVVGCRDPFKEVDGKGIEKLLAAGIDVKVGVLESACKELNKRFFTFHSEHRPYIILKWAQTANKKIATSPKPSPKERALKQTDKRLLITNALTNKLVHKWRSEEAAILVGTNTALLDDPELSNRLWSGKSPTRLVVDMHLRLPRNLKIFDGKQPTIIFNTLQHSEDVFKILPPPGGVRGGLYQVTDDVSIVHQILNACYQNNIQSILVEGGAKLLQTFIDEGLWDEARIITNELLIVEEGLAAPELSNHQFTGSTKILDDRIAHYKKTN
ncbi:bifunctional diaminohydroxyphosphoribosylaminopyrimidine deaminase/5-amino-6-(5-phosphoribosylamino)uracil reductase RibD [Panacibacter ginsenosidivorans]|uniref:Riboflavin biosynthesis protein RibD n=1 Tax=Panacibacter ginsenosidivorans TaxID=1813871 RepID=A0A5B8V9W1_9BACT|nr:bifunctional diaminohydroxyphosphoribosylaminopyrimidine deaminase/5-amino-6-(5-phosphoribosylamino)uracil reductase RibD [Panacibacter ginsenosidivorans]QEC67506.1 bifunctional diaminohydroxyphosphoribosylaminopyrimidine deaminase/5-amino-6-(5-phosphoribosylamino)uracil reductase RibD [Panacibacter ginsenosidivorans]